MVAIVIPDAIKALSVGANRVVYGPVPSSVLISPALFTAAASNVKFGPLDTCAPMVCFAGWLDVELLLLQVLTIIPANKMHDNSTDNAIRLMLFIFYSEINKNYNFLKK
jgi:hypothetical protein